MSQPEWVTNNENGPATLYLWKTYPKLARWGLDAVSAMYEKGTVSDAEVDAYLAAWNETPCRFNIAYRQGANICLRLKRDNE